MQQNLNEWIKNLSMQEVQRILQNEHKRLNNYYKYLHSDKGKAKRRELNAKYYQKRKAQKELS